MRGEIWTFARPGRGEPIPLLVIQAEPLNGAAPTVVGVIVTTIRQTAGPPLTIPLGAEAGLGPRASAKVTQVHTVPAGDAQRQLGRLGRDTMRLVDEALVAVLGLGILSGARSAT